MSKFEDLISLLVAKDKPAKSTQETDSLRKLSPARLQPLPQEPQTGAINKQQLIADQMTIECPATSKVARYPLNAIESKIYTSLVGACVYHCETHRSRPYSLLVNAQDLSRIGAHISKIEGVYTHTLMFAGRSITIQAMTDVPEWLQDVLPDGIQPGYVYTLS
jgi:hypothetical protein